MYDTIRFKWDPDFEAWGALAPRRPNQTSNQTSARGLVSWPRLPRFSRFPFHFPFRTEKGSALSARAPRGPGERGRGWAIFLQRP